jgi:phage shock protein A
MRRLISFGRFLFNAVEQGSGPMISPPFAAERPLRRVGRSRLRRKATSTVEAPDPRAIEAAASLAPPWQANYLVGMFEDIRRIFRRSVDAFRSELSAREPEDQVAELLSAMRREMVAVRASIPQLEEEAVRLRADLERERSALADTERRRTLAERIGDEETVRIAAEFAGRHRERIQVLEQKIAAADAEVALRRREADEMVHRYREADANRFALLAQLRRAGARQRMQGSLSDEGGLAGDFERMREKVERDSAYADALEDLDPPAPPEPKPSPAEIDQRLQELKRRMGRE